MSSLRRYGHRLLLLFIPLILFSCSTNEQNKEFRAVIRIIDGDTFCVEDGTEKGEKVRLIGVNAPESRKVFKKKVQYFGKEAKAYLTKYLTDKNVRLEYDVAPKDRYGRTLAYVYLEDGTFLNAKLVEDGYAQVMTVPPNVKYADLFLDLQRKARDNNRGLWGR